MISTTITNARAQLFNLVDEAAESHRPVTITGKRNNAVLVGEDDWRAIQETLYLLSVQGMRQSIQRARSEPLKAGVTRTRLWSRDVDTDIRKGRTKGRAKAGKGRATAKSRKTARHH